jgi:hypothetical protein
MPFKSEKQRRYLWANEPEIARDWTDTYGSGIAKALGGRIPFSLGGQFQDWLGNLYGSQGIAQLQSQYGAGATGKPSDARHIAAMSGLSDTLNPNNLMPFTGDTLAFGAGLINEIPGVYRAIKGQAPIGDVWEDIKANWKGTYGTKYGAKPEDIFKQVYARDSENIPTLPLGAEPMTLGPNYNYGQVEATPEGIMKAGGFQENVSDPSVMQPHDFEFGDQWQTAEEDDESSNWLMRALSMVPVLGKNTRSGWAARQLLNRFSGNDGIMSAYNRTPRDPNYGRGLSGNVSWAGQRYDKQYGTGAYKMKTLRDRYDRLKKSKSQSTWNAIQKEKVRKELAAKEAAYKKKSREAWQKDYSGWQSPSGRDHAGTAGIGSKESKQGHGGSSHVGASRFN